MMSWTARPLLGLDTETTGIDVDHDRVVTAALVRRDAVGTRFRTWLIDPGVEIPEAASAIHGVSSAHARAHGVPPATGLEQIAATLVDAVTHGAVLVAFNASYDLAILDAELHRHALPTLPERLGTAVAPVLDPLVLDRMLDPARPGPRRLVDLCAHYGVPTGTLHTADADTIATLDVLGRLVEAFPDLAARTAAEVHAQQVDAVHAWREAYRRRKEAERLAQLTAAPADDDARLGAAVTAPNG